MTHYQLVLLTVALVIVNGAFQAFRWVQYWRFGEGSALMKPTALGNCYIAVPITSILVALMIHVSVLTALAWSAIASFGLAFLWRFCHSFWETTERSLGQPID